MTKIIRILEVDPESLIVKEPRLGANGSVEVFAVDDNLASEILQFVEAGETLDSSLLEAIAQVEHWQTHLLSTRKGRLKAGYADLAPAARRALAAQYLRMRHEHAKLPQIEGFEVTADYELRWYMG